MKVLRILTGRHAGAGMALPAGQYAIGNAEDADVFLSDWEGPELLLTVADDHDGAVAARMQEGNASETATPPLETVLLQDKVPLAFGETVLCVGDDAGPWPSDLVLLQSMFGEAAEHGMSSDAVDDDASTEAMSKKQTRVRAALSVLVVTLFGCMVGASILWWSSQSNSAISSSAALPATAAEVAARLREGFGRAGMPELVVVESNNRLTVIGMVNDGGDNVEARALIDQEQPFPVDIRFSVATNVVQYLQSSLGDPDISVSYSGDGKFVVKGKTTSPEELRKRVDRIKLDLSQNIKQVTVEPSAPKPVGPRYSALVSQRDLGYMQTEDGVKHVFLGGLGDLSTALPGPTGGKQ